MTKCYRQEGYTLFTVEIRSCNTVYNHMVTAKCEHLLSIAFIKSSDITGVNLFESYNH